MKIECRAPRRGIFRQLISKIWRLQALGLNVENPILEGSGSIKVLTTTPTRPLSATMAPTSSMAVCADTMQGRGGNDLDITDNASDVIVEAAGPVRTMPTGNRRKHIPPLTDNMRQTRDFPFKAAH
ncbi:hypothetical protein [Pararhizobium sp. LjRoot238]|uniref:hypothetical protein n=1 Tax=Pararhizobium sp. LjRoot238 TaxID=3342293 RepID=UPI003ECD7B4A